MFSLPSNEVRHIPVSRLEISVAKIPVSDQTIDLDNFFEQRLKAPFRTLYLEPYKKEFDIASKFEDRQVTTAKTMGTDIVRGSKQEEYQAALKNDGLDELIGSTFDEILTLGPELSLIDTLGFFKIVKTEEFFFKIDILLNMPSKNPLALVLIPNYQKTGYNFEDKVIITDIDRDSHQNAFKFKGETSIRISGSDEIMDLEYVFVGIFEVLLSEDQLEIEQVAFTVMPNKTLDFYLHGVFQLPIYKETIMFKDMQFMKDMNFWEIALMCQKKYKDGVMKRTEGSVIVRLGPEELEDTYKFPDDTMLCNTMFIGNEVLAEESIFTEENYEIALESAPISETLSSDYDPAEVAEVIESYLQNVLMKPTSSQGSVSRHGNSKKSESEKKNKREGRFL